MSNKPINVPVLVLGIGLLTTAFGLVWVMAWIGETGPAWCNIPAVVTGLVGGLGLAGSGVACVVCGSRIDP